MIHRAYVLDDLIKELAIIKTILPNNAHNQQLIIKASYCNELQLLQQLFMSAVNDNSILTNGFFTNIGKISKIDI